MSTLHSSHAVHGLRRSCPECGAANRIDPTRLHERAGCGRCHAVLSPPDSPIHVTSAAAFDELLASSLPLVVDFWAGWCGPCVMTSPEVDRLARHMTGRVLVAKVDTEAHPELASRWSVRSLPSFVLYEGGREKKRSVGARPAEGIAQDLGLSWVPEYRA